jgi:hypothetical protein
MLIVLLSAGLLAQAGVSPPGNVTPPVEPCFHGAQETEIERARRTDAVAAMRMIDWVMRQHGVEGLRDVWPVMGNLTAAIILKDAEGRVGELARRIGWGADEPLPGWRITLSRSSRSRQVTVYALTDTRDPCALTLLSTDPDVVPPRPYGVMPLDAVE